MEVTDDGQSYADKFTNNCQVTIVEDKFQDFIGRIDGFVGLSGSIYINSIDVAAHTITIDVPNQMMGFEKLYLNDLEGSKNIYGEEPLYGNLVCAYNPDTKILLGCDIPIFTDTGCEVLTGSTRLKAGTAQKIVLNTLTTCAMTKTGKVYENMMINLSPSNEKLKRRVIGIVREILSCEEDEAIARLEANDWNIRKAVEK